MTRNEMIEFATLAVCIARMPECEKASAYSVSVTVAKLSRLGIESKRNAERLCSDERFNQDLYDRKVDSISRRAFQALAELGFPCTSVKLEIKGDPRGSCLKVSLPGAGMLFF